MIHDEDLIGFYHNAVTSSHIDATDTDCRIAEKPQSLGIVIGVIIVCVFRGNQPDDSARSAGTTKDQASTEQPTVSLQDILETVFQDAEVEGFEILDTLCRSTLCRISLQPDDSKTGNEIVENLGRLIPLLPWNSGAWFSLTDTGEVVGYLAREGHVLPETAISQAF